MSDNSIKVSIVDRILSGLGTLIKILIGLLVLLIVGGIPLIASAQWIRGSTLNAFAYCEMKRMEARIDSQAGSIYIDWCMQSEGYRRESVCLSDSIPLPNCFYPRWQVWK